jgi:hypothetical protein
MHIPIEWILGVLALLASVIGTLATVIYQSLSQRIAAQDTIILKLQDDVDRLSKGCGIGSCLWRNR